MRKGGIEVSIGFLIVMIVAALTMIFIMGWMGNLFPSIQEMGTYATESARKQMMEEFGKGNAPILATIPDSMNYAPGTEVAFIIGVKKQSGVDDKGYFNLCVAKAGETEDCESDTADPIAAAGDNDDDASGVTFSYHNSIPLRNRDQTDTVLAKMQIPAGIEPDTYGFVIYACAKDGPSDECSGISDPDYYGMYDFQITVK